MSQFYQKNRGQLHGHAEKRGGQQNYTPSVILAESHFHPSRVNDLPACSAIRPKSWYDLIVMTTPPFNPCKHSRCDKPSAFPASWYCPLHIAELSGLEFMSEPVAGAGDNVILESWREDGTWIARVRNRRGHARVFVSGFDSRESAREAALALHRG